LRYRSAPSAHPNDMQLQPGSFVPLPLGLAVPMITLACCVGKPKGHGTLTFTSVDPRAAPRIENDFLEHDEDRDKAIEAMELAWLCATSKPMRALGWHFFPSERTLSRRKWIEEWIPRSCDSGYHPSGTVPMGADDDRDAACDGRGRVRGVEGLIVADASLMPTITSSNTNLPTLMIGERFGEWLRDGAP
jgi:choline dehydrogenase